MGVVSTAGPRRSGRRVAPAATATLAAACVAATVAVSPAAADPLPGFDLSAEKLRERMDDCLAYSIGEREILMGWLHARTGEGRQWRCSSLRHMLSTDDRDGPPHDPYTDVAGFMRCVDRVVSYGFVRDANKAGHRQHILQYHGTKRAAHVIFNGESGDIVTIYTSPDNDWDECATWSP